MAASISLALARRHVPALLAGTALAASSMAFAETASLGVTVTVEPRCAVSTPSQAALASAAAATTAPAEMMEVACTSGASWSVETERSLAPGEPSLAVATERAPRSAPAAASGSAAAATPDPAQSVTITIRY